MTTKIFRGKESHGGQEQVVKASSESNQGEGESNQGEGETTQGDGDQEMPPVTLEMASKSMNLPQFLLFKKG